MRTPFPYFGPQAPKACILLAEDDSEFRALLATALREDGFDVVEATDGHALLDLLADAISTGEVDRFDLVVSDIRMPGYSALDILAGARWALRHTPVILITAFGDSATHARAKHLGAKAVFDKPFEIDDFRTAIQLSLSNGRAHASQMD